MKKTKLLTSLAAFVLVLGLGACEETSEEGTSSEEDVTTDETTGSTDVTLPVLGEVEDGSYFLGFNMDNVDYYFNGTVYNTNYAGVTSEIGLAVPVTVAAIDGGYSLSFDDDGNTAYLNLTESGTYRNLKWGSEVYTWSYDTTYSVFVGLDSEGDYYFIGTYGTYKDLTVSAYGYLTGDIETTNAQYPAKLYAIPDDWEATAPREDAGVSYEDIDDLSLLGYYDFSKSVSTEVSGTGAFGATKDDAPAGPTNEEVLKIFSDAYVEGVVTTSPLTSVSYNDYAYKGAGGNTGSGNSGLQLSEACLKLGKSGTGNEGELTLTVAAEGYTLSKLVITASGWSDTTTTLSVNDNAQTLTQSAKDLSYVDEVDSYTYDLSDAASLKLEGSARVLIFGIAIYGEEAEAEPQTEELIIDEDFGENNGHEYDEYYYFNGETYTSLTSCDLVFSGENSQNTIKAFTNYLRLPVGSSITFTPKNGYKLVEISFTYNRSDGSALGVTESTATVTYDSNGATISDIVDGSSALTVTNIDTLNIDFSTITITYL